MVMTHSNSIAYYRDRCDPPLTQADLAAIIGVHPNTVQNWERGGVARPGALLGLARVFVERGALSSYPDALAFWQSATRAGNPPPADLRALFAAPTSHAAGPTLALPLGDPPPPTPGLAPLPFPPNPRFVGRDADLRVLAALLRLAGSVAVICGLGGLGKTQLASEFALRYGPWFPGGVCWLDAANPATLEAQIAEQGGPDLHPRFAQLGLARRLALVRAAWATDTPRLLIFDNCEDPTIVFTHRPARGGCRVLATSRTRDWLCYPMAQIVDLAPISRRDSVALLRSYVQARDADEACLAGIAAAVGDLPLALHLAGRHLAAAPDAAAYLRQLSDAPRLHHRSFVAGGPSPTGYCRSLSETIAYSYERLGDDPVGAEARALLDVARLLAPGAPIPFDFLCAALGQTTPPAPATSAPLARLHEASGLVELLPDGRRIRVHHVVHAFLNELPPAPERRRFLHHAVRAQGAAAERAGLPLPRPLVVHLCHIADQAAAESHPEAGALCAALAWPLATGAEYARARDYAERAVALHEHAHSPRHPDVAEARNTLALILQITQGYAAAEGHFQQALAIWERARGPDSAEVATACNNLGFLALLCSRYGEAEVYLRRALAIRRRVHGLDDAGTARIIHNLGYLALEAGRLRAAARYLSLALGLRRRLLPDPSLATAFTLHLLTEVRLRQGDLGTARALAEQALAQRQAAVDEEHDDIAASLALLAQVARAAGDLARAQALAERALALREQTLGPAAPETLASLALLGGTLMRQGRQDEGRSLVERALTELRATAGAGSRFYAGAARELAGDACGGE